jgi:hypothetical protein
VCVCVCIYICICIMYIYTYMHTYIHTYGTLEFLRWLGEDSVRCVCGRMCVNRAGVYGLTGETKKKSEEKKRIRRYGSRRGRPLGSRSRAAPVFMPILSRLILFITYGRGYALNEK